MFPSNPNINDSHTEQNKTFIFNGEGWVLQSFNIIKVNKYSEMQQLINGNKYLQFFVVSDETHSGISSRYDWTGTKLIKYTIQDV